MTHAGLCNDGSAPRDVAGYSERSPHTHAAQHVTAAAQRTLLATVDVEIASDRSLPPQVAVLERLADDFADLPLTLFCTATAAEAFSKPLRRLASRGHTIGCHGLDHGKWEDYRRLDRAVVRRTIADATKRIEGATGVRPRVFRGPAMTTSSITQDELEQQGYVADFSPCARRVDPLASSAYEPSWIKVPNRPYYSSSASPFVVGNRRLLSVPLTGFGVPFLSGALYVLGPTALRRMLRAFLAVQRASSPLVYLFHTYEFVDLLAKTSGKLPWHHQLYGRDTGRRYRDNLDLLTWLVRERSCAALAADAFLPMPEPGAHSCR